MKQVWVLYLKQKQITLTTCKYDELKKLKNIISVHKTFSQAKDSLCQFYLLRKNKANRDAAYFRQRLVNSLNLNLSDFKNPR